MEKLTASDIETKSPDIVAENIEQLRGLFPEAFVEGRIDFDILKQLLGRALDEREEKYGLNWHGKRRARQIALTPSTGTLRPCPDESVDWDTTQNLLIEGDNLEVLKLLQKSYAGKVKLIYIDPPYNTGGEFVYSDDFRDNIRNYLELTGQLGSEGRKFTANTETSGRFHTEWLNMMYPRLKLARSLLGSDGAIFISIDDNEVDNLRKLCDEVLGEENFVATVIWQKVYSPKNSAKHFSEDHDYVIVYARNADLWRPNLLPRSEEANARYANPDNDSRGDWKPSGLDARNYYGEGVYSITCPSGRIIEGPPQGSYWRVSKEKFLELDRDGRIWWGKEGNNVPAIKRFLTEVMQGMVPQTMWFYQDVGHTQDGKRELLQYVKYDDTDNVLDTVKPTRLLRRILLLATAATGSDLVLDFFAGSCSTAHAVLAQNRADGGDRRFVCVQIPEPLPRPERLLKLLTDVGKQRVSNVITSFKKEAEGQLNLTDRETPEDLGFRVFRLASTNIREWDPDRDTLPQSLLDSAEHLKSDRTEQDILFELLLKLGLELTAPIKQKVIAGKTVYGVGAGALIVCLAPQIGRKEIEPLAHGIVAWRKELEPSGDTQVVFRDSAFGDDVAKTNITAILQQYGIGNVKSL